LPRHDEGDSRVPGGHNAANSKVPRTKGSGRSEKGDERNEKSGYILENLSVEEVHSPKHAFSSLVGFDAKEDGLSEQE